MMAFAMAAPTSPLTVNGPKCHQRFNTLLERGSYARSKADGNDPYENSNKTAKRINCKEEVYVSQYLAEGSDKEADKV